MITYKQRQEKLEEAFKNVMNDENFIAWIRLRKQGGWDRFSFNNQMSLFGQTFARKQHPARCLTLTAWQRDYKVRVKSTEYHKPLWVLRPVFVAKPKVDASGNPVRDAQGNQKTEQVLVGFQGLKQYAEWQIDGQLPKIAEAVTGDTHKQYLDKLTAYAVKHGATVAYGDAKGADGYFRPSTREIVLSDKLEPNGAVKVLIHEIAHMLRDGQDESYAQGETIAETAAFMVCEGIGIDCAKQAAEYVMVWAKQDIGKALKAMEAADKLARDIETAF